MAIDSVNNFMQKYPIAETYEKGKFGAYTFPPKVDGGVNGTGSSSVLSPAQYVDDGNGNLVSCSSRVKTNLGEVDGVGILGSPINPYAKNIWVG